jgi:serine/threonine-protein kinase
VAGLSQQDAAGAVKQAGLVATVAGDRVYDDDAAVNTVARTDPPIGRRAVRGGRVVLYLSKGPAPRQVPDVANRSRDDAWRSLRDRDLQVSTQLASDENVAPGNAIRTEPGAGTTVDRGAHVTLFVSTGPAKRTVPTLVGKSRGEAIETLNGLRLKFSQGPVEFSENVPAGAVIRSVPPAGSQVDRDSTVQLVLSKGPQRVRVPDVIGKPLGEAKRQLERAGFTVVVRSLFGQNNGDVLGQTPLPFKLVKPGATITLGVL